MRFWAAAKISCDFVVLIVVFTKVLSYSENKKLYPRIGVNTA
jgi:hypothetical protein